MRQIKIFSGSSHPSLVEAICERLGTSPAECELKKFSNGETSVGISTSIRDQDVFIVQSGSSKVNDSVMELLIMISACKGGSAKSITAVMPYFPYSRQSRKKTHRGAIAARMVANLLSIAGVHHVITVDLHAPPSQGFFGKPVDNLHAEPLIARWVRNNVTGWKDAVVVSKTPGGSKRVTSLADALKLNFGIVTTDRRRTPLHGTTSLETSQFLEGMRQSPVSMNHGTIIERDADSLADNFPESGESSPRRHGSKKSTANSTQSAASPVHKPSNGHVRLSPLCQSTQIDFQPPSTTRLGAIPRSSITSDSTSGLETDGDSTDEYTDERATDVITGRLIQGRLVDDDYPSPVLSTMSGSVTTLPGELPPPKMDDRDPMASSFFSTNSANAAAAASDEEDEGFKNSELEHTITLVGNVKDKVVLIMDDLIDQCESWIAAAETVVKKGGAKKVYCVATHGLFGDDSLEMMEKCKCIDFIVVTNSYPIASQRIQASKKLVILDISQLLAEAIRRNHYGESISQLYQHYPD